MEVYIIVVNNVTFLRSVDVKSCVLSTKDIPEQSLDVKSALHVLPKMDIPEQAVDVKSASRILFKRDISGQSVDMKSSSRVLSKRDIPNKPVDVKFQISHLQTFWGCLSYCIKVIKNKNNKGRKL